jgi:hypothetical protein
MEAMTPPLEAAHEAAAAELVPPAHPGEIDFSRWLRARTPAGAPTLEVSAPGARAPLALPRIRPAALTPAGRRGRRRRGAAPALHAAFLIDIEGLTPLQLARSALLGHATERSARQHARDGRFVAAELGLWPWAVVGGQALHRAWWADARFALALTSWALEPRPPEVEPAVRRL